MCENSIKVQIAAAIAFFFENVPRQLHISCAIRHEKWARNKGPSEPKLLTLDVEYRMNAGRKMSDVATVRGAIERAE